MIKTVIQFDIVDRFSILVMLAEFDGCLPYNGDCVYGCVATGTSYYCTCPHPLHLELDNKTCSGEFDFPLPAEWDSMNEMLELKISKFAVKKEQKHESDMASVKLHISIKIYCWPSRFRILNAMAYVGLNSANVNNYCNITCFHNCWKLI